MPFFGLGLHLADTSTATAVGSGGSVSGPVPDGSTVCGLMTEDLNQNERFLITEGNDSANRIGSYLIQESCGGSSYNPG